MFLQRILIIVVATILGMGAPCKADDARPPRETASENGRFSLRIEAGRPGSRDGRGCIGKLVEAAGRSSRTVWERTLVNDVGPLQAAIRDDGKFVVTLDEYRRGGARHAMVIYNERGEMLRHFLLTDLLNAADWPNVRVSKRSLDWLRDAEYAFVENPDEFRIRLRWGREIRVDLKRLRLVHEGESSSNSTGAPAAILDAMFHGDENGRDAADSENPDSKGPLAADGVVDPLVAEALGAVGIDRGFLGAEVIEPEVQGAPGVLVDPVDGMHPSWNGHIGAPRVTAGIPVPRPDPMNPVNYLEWANEQAKTAGENAAPVLKAAIDNFVPFEGPEELYNAAIGGAPAALASPEIQNWLAQNQAALTHFGDAPLYDFRGWQMESQGGSMIGALLPTLGPTRNLAKAAVIEGKSLEMLGDADGAAARYLDTLAAGAQVGQGPTMIENLVGVAVQALASESLLDMAAGPTADKIDYADLASKLEYAYETPRPVTETMQFERAMFMDTMQRVFEPDPSTGELRISARRVNEFFSMVGDDGGLNAQFLATLPAMRFEEVVAAGNAYYDETTRAAQLPYPEAREQLSLLEKNMVENPNANPLLRVLTPALSRVVFLRAKAESARRATLLTTNLMAYRQQYGTLPEHLNELGERPFISDPLSGQHFVYRRNGEDFVLYSLGQNGVDDGGLHDARGEQNDTLYWPRPVKE